MQISSISNITTSAARLMRGAAFTLENLGDGVFKLTSGDLCEAAMAQLRGARVLILHSSDLTDRGLQLLKATQGLKVRLFSGCAQVSMEGLRSVSQMGNLKTWGVTLSDRSHASITGEAFAALDLTRLDDLRIWDFDRIANTDLHAILGKTQLWGLTIDNCTNVTAEGLKNLSKQVELVDLSLEYIRGFTDEHMAWLRPLKNVERLTLNSLFISDKGLSVVKTMPRLYELNLYNLPGVTRDGFRPSGIYTVSWTNCPGIKPIS